jgi:AraC-like DNA-binding protein
MASQVVAFPLPLMTSVLGFIAASLCLRLNLGTSPARFFFAAFFTMVAAGSFLVGLRFGYGIEWLKALQRSLPLFIGPLLYLGFASLTAVSDKLLRIAAAHIGCAIGLALLTLLPGGPRFLPDLLIAASYAIYAFLLFRIWKGGPNSMVRAPLENAGSVATWSGVAAGFLVLALIFDTIIAVFFARRENADATALISTGAVLMMVLLVGVIYAFSLRPTQRRVQSFAKTSSGRDPILILAAAEDLMMREELFIDTGLTADRLAKRLHVPTRALSEAINQNRGKSISQFVNGFRLRRAAELLATTDMEIPDVMARSGFLTRSNFYRGFQHEYGEGPMAYRAKHQGKERFVP